MKHTGQMILSVDVGLKNLAVCKLQKTVHGVQIVMWKLLHVQSSSCESIVEALDAEESLLDDVTTLLIEKQMRNNYKMSFLAHAIEMYMFTRGLWMNMKTLRIVRCPASERCKNAGYIKGNGTKAQEYKKRKLAAIEFTKKNISKDWLEFLESHKKQDDLCDSFAQGFLFFK